MANELTGVSAFLYQRLAADATLVGLLTRLRPNSNPPVNVLNLYRDRAPQDATYPFVVVRFLSAVDTHALPVTTRIMTDTLWLVECYTNQPNLAVPDQIADRIDSVLQGAQGNVVSHGIHVMGVYRQQATLAEEIEADQTYFRLGGEYRTRVSRL